MIDEAEGDIKTILVFETGLSISLTDCEPQGKKKIEEFLNSYPFLIFPLHPI